MNRRGFALADLLAVVVVVTVGAVLAANAHAPARAEAMGLASMRNLQVIGQIASVYQNEHDGLVSAYSWKAGVDYQVLGEAAPRPYSDDQEAHAAQQKDILRRLTGRVTGDDAILNNSVRIADRRFSHLVLADYFGFPANSELWADPADRNLRQWQQHPLDLDSMPYGEGNPDASVYDDDNNWEKKGVVQRWAYASSYQWVPDAYQTGYGPVADTPHLFAAGAAFTEMGGRTIDEVAFPGQKVWIHAEFEWRPRYDWGAGAWVSDGLWATYGAARAPKLMFDGSVNDLPASRAGSSWNPGDPATPVWRQRYIPLDTFPLPNGDRTRQLDQRFRWTRDGLAGIDYAP